MNIYIYIYVYIYMYIYIYISLHLIFPTKKTDMNSEVPFVVLPLNPLEQNNQIAPNPGPNNGGAEMATPGPGAYMVSSTVGGPGAVNSTIFGKEHIHDKLSLNLRESIQTFFWKVKGFFSLKIFCLQTSKFATLVGFKL